MVTERVRLFSGSEELSPVDGWIERTNDILTDQAYCEIDPYAGITQNSVISYRKDDGVSVVLTPRVKNVKQGTTWKIELSIKAAELNSASIDKVYPAGSTPEGIVKDIIDGSENLTWGATIVSGITLTKPYYAKKYKIDAIKDMLTILNWQTRITALDVFYLEPKGTIDTGITLVDGVDGQISQIERDGNQVVNSVKIIGGFENFNTTEPLVGTNTVFTLTNKPEGSMKVTVGGVEVDTTSYSVDGEQKTVTFDTSKTDPTFYYSYQQPAIVFDQDDDSISSYGEKFQEIPAPWINHVDDATVYAKEYINENKKEGTTIVFKKAGLDFDRQPNESVIVQSSIRSPAINAKYVICKVRLDIINGTTTFEFGSRFPVAGDWQRGIQDRIKALEEQNINDVYKRYIRTVSHSLQTRISLVVTAEYATAGNSLVYGHKTLGWYRNSLDREADCSGNGRYGDWQGSGIGGSQFSTSGWRLGCANFNGSDNYVSLSEGIGYTTAYSVFLAFKTSSPGQSDKLFFSNGSSTDADPLFTIGTGVGTSTVRIFVRNDAGTTLLSKEGDTTITADVWHTLFWIDDNGTCELWIDGVQDTADFNYTPSGTLTFDRTAIGAQLKASASAFFSGSIDEVRVYNTLLSAAERAKILNNQEANNGLTLYWSLDNPYLGNRFSARVAI